MTRRSLLLLFASLGLVGVAPAQVPQLINYQGRMVVAGTNFSGSGGFKFALVNSNAVPTFWANSAGSVNGSEPSVAVTLTVNNGLYSVLLGDTTIANMAAIPASIFTNSDVRLRVWFNGGTGFQQLTPDQRIASVGYALMAANVPDGSISSSKLADGAVTAAKLAPGAVTAAALGSSLSVGATNLAGRVDVYGTAAGTPGVSLIGSASQVSTFGSDGQEQIRLWGTGYGEMLLHDNSSSNMTTVQLSAFESFNFLGTTLPSPGGSLHLKSSSGGDRAWLKGGDGGGSLYLYQGDGGVGVSLQGDSGGAGLVLVRGTNGSTRASLDGSDGGGGTLRLNESDGTETVSLTSQGNGALVLKQGDGSAGVGISANNGTGGGGVSVYRNNGTFAGQLTVDSTSGFLGLANNTGVNRFYATGSNPSGSQGGYLGLINAAGKQTVTLDADASGEGRVTTQVLQITGGSDLSEKFDITSIHAELKAGLIVCIDSDHPGHLVTSSKPYDKTVAGIISGAGGVKPGMVMGQKGTSADGQHAVALSGRVYTWADAGAGAIHPGDLLTTSRTAGHAMKVKDTRKAQGAIIGKAMTALEKGRGLVLILVSLQ